jgi:hypothetical protein
MSALDEIVRWLNEHDSGKDQSGDDARFAVGVGMFQINRQVRAGQSEEHGEDS